MTPSVITSDDEEERLRHALAFVDGHVKFAETKNAALFAIDAAALLALLQALSAEHPIDHILRVYLWVLVGSAIASLVVTLVSFLPVTQLPWLRRPATSQQFRNLWFFGDVQGLNASSYISDLLTAVGKAAREPLPVERMLADQIIINSRIAARKFTYFRIALWCALFGVLTPPIGLLLLAWTSNRDV